LRALIGASNGRVQWHGTVPREGLATVLDGSDVLVLPNRADFARGQDSMKLYDYAARGRPIVATSGGLAGATEPPPHVYHADTAEDFAAAILDASSEDRGRGHARRLWAGEQTWTCRWPSWSQAVFGEPLVQETP
jgi:glycosyltransferase involved in cell wall biosynthesis